LRFAAILTSSWGIVLRVRQAPVIDGVSHASGPMQGYVLPGGVEHSAYLGPEGATVVDIFQPVRDDHRDRWHSLERGTGARYRKRRVT
jgi:hypothetical protein